MNISILYLDIISCLTILLLSRLIFKSFRHPIFLICAWWSACLILSNIVLIGEGPNPRTHLVFLLFIYSIMGFGLIFQISTRVRTFPIPKIIARHWTFWIALSIVIYLLSVWLGVIGYKLQGVYGPEFRALSFSTGEYSSLLYGSYYLQVAADLVLSPFVLFGVIALPIAGIFYDRSIFLLLGLIFSVAIDFKGSSRFHLYYFLLAIALAVIIVKRFKFLSRITLLPIVFATIIFLAIISKQRMQADAFNMEIIENTIEQAVKYHVYGVYLFDYEFSDDASMLHQGTSYGRLTLLSYPERIFCMVLRRLGILAISTIDEIGEHWQKSVRLGFDKDSRLVIANAFYTSLYPIFYDYGYLGIVLVPGLFIYFLVVHYKTYLLHNNITSLFVVIFLTILFMTSIFNSKITSGDFSVIFYCILLLDPVRKVSRKGVIRSRITCSNGSAGLNHSRVGRLNRDQT